MHTHRSRERDNPPDAVVVPGAQVRLDGRASPSLQRRVAAAVEALGRFPDAALVGCGGTGTADVSEAAVIRDLAIAYGVPGERVVLEDTSSSTLGHAINLRLIAAERGWSRLLVVTDAFHLPRARFLFRRCGFDVEGIAVPRSGRSMRRWWVEGYLREVLAWVKALIDVGRGRHRRR